jgi:hypothetical protein
MRDGFATGRDVRSDCFDASQFVKMHGCPVRRIGIQEIGRAAVLLSGMISESAAQSEKYMGIEVSNITS